MRAASSRARDAWAASGAMALTGDADTPPMAPRAPLALVMEAAGEVAETADAAALLGERAALMGLTRHGRVSCGGGARLLPTADGFLAVALPRPEDLASVDAWLGVDSTWDAVAGALAERPAEEAAALARLLEIPVAVPGERAPEPAPWNLQRGATADPIREPLVVDLSALWAGPLCADLLRRAGARVIKVEDPNRPDGARRGNREFFDRLNAGKRDVHLELASSNGRRLLCRLLDAADVVVTSSRPRAFERLGIDVDAHLERSPTVWVAVTAHGWSGPGRDRVGFGDDCAVAGGLVVDGPRFVADAVADPLTGVLAAAVASSALHAGGSWLIDVSLAGVAAWAAGLDGGAGACHFEVTPPRARAWSGAAPDLGADTAAVLAELG